MWAAALEKDLGSRIGGRGDMRRKGVLAQLYVPCKQFGTGFLYSSHAYVCVWIRLVVGHVLLQC